MLRTYKLLLHLIIASSIALPKIAISEKNGCTQQENITRICYVPLIYRQFFVILLLITVQSSIRMMNQMVALLVAAIIAVTAIHAEEVRTIIQILHILIHFRNNK